MDWTKEEVRLIVEDYFKMLQLELGQQKYNKTSHRLTLYPLLNNRSLGSIEFKHQNISAVLAKMGLPFIKGYKPRYNFQKILESEVLIFLKENQLTLEEAFKSFSERIITLDRFQLFDFEHIVDMEPLNSMVKEEEPQYHPIKTNYLEKEQNNRQLGEEGERLIIEYERWRLIKDGKEDLADKIEWTSKDLGDGTGYDILSKNVNGTDRFIEVKTTKLSKETPIYLTRTELSFASLKRNNFYLYRVFNFDSYPQFFIRHGDYEEFCRLQPLTFKGYF